MEVTRSFDRRCVQDSKTRFAMYGADKLSGRCCGPKFPEANHGNKDDSVGACEAQTRYGEINARSEEVSAGLGSF